MPKNTTKILGALAGAVLAPVVVIAGVLLLYRPRGSENWDMGTPMLTMAALLPAAFLGAVVGYVTVDLVRAGDRKAVCWLGGSGALLIVLIPVGIVALPFLLSLLPSRPPSVEETRASGRGGSARRRWVSAPSSRTGCRGASATASRPRARR